MSLRTLRYCVAIIVFMLMGASATHGQGAVEYGTLTSGNVGVAASAKPPVPKLAQPGSASSAGPGANSSFLSVPAVSPEETAKTNREFFQLHSGPDAAQISLRTVPDHAGAWIDSKFVGRTPLDLKLAPGHHRVMVRATNMQDSIREFDLVAKQTLSIDFTLKSGYQSEVIIHWPAKKN